MSDLLASVSLPSLEATEALAARLAPLLKTRDFLALTGPLGAGKTSFARALLRALGVTGEIPSPTFTLVQTYDTSSLSVAHFDLYRLKGPEDLEELGWDDACADCLVLAEWPERAGSLVPRAALTLAFDVVGEGRVVRLSGPAVWGARLEPVIKGNEP